MSFIDDIPAHVSSRVIDAWMAIPPCSYRDNAYCHVDCPYFCVCYTDLDSDFEDF